ncbi:MAG: GDSL-type esterase/lipase family protein [Carboxylicivirga sp.]|jgi:alpha-L-fucosidase 2|nr:GDSL-type esterase/lipase family protein [Carboxylicivirga sp.]
MKTYLPYLLLFSVLLFSCQKETKVACIGDSITNGGGKSQASFYPVQLNHLLGADFKVLNCGESGATMQRDGNYPYWYQKDLHNALMFEPDIAVILLGTNDSKTNNWKATSYERDYQAMIDTLNSLDPQPKIYLCTPPPAYNSAWTISDSTIRSGVIPIVNNIAQRNGLTVIDLYKGMSNKAELFPDGIHPNEEGIKLMAEIIAEAIK